MEGISFQPLRKPLNCPLHIITHESLNVWGPDMLTSLSLSFPFCKVVILSTPLVYHVHHEY